ATLTLKPLVGARSGARPGLVRLTAVELRKTIDTRAGFWLQVCVLVLMVGVAVVVSLVGKAEDHTLRDLLAATLQPPIALLGVVGILLISSEWSQRTTLITFALVPQRSRVLAAKLIAGAVLATAAVAISLALSALVTAIAAPGVDGTWSLTIAQLGQGWFSAVIAMIMGLGFGAALLSPVPAIVLYFGLPLAWTALGSIPALTGTARWLDGGRSLSPLTEHALSTTEWARVGTTLAVWMLIPVLLGLWRIRRSELS